VKRFLQRKFEGHLSGKITSTIDMAHGRANVMGHDGKSSRA